MLAMYPEVQKKLYQEISTKLANIDQLEYEHLAQLTYLNMVIDETLRLMQDVVF